jgi:2-aminobenzoate-CoA ligase
VLKAGGVVVATMPMLRVGELVYPIRKAKIALALCDDRMLADLDCRASPGAGAARIVSWGGDAVRTAWTR